MYNTVYAGGEFLVAPSLTVQEILHLLALLFNAFAWGIVLSLMRDQSIRRNPRVRCKMFGSKPTDSRRGVVDNHFVSLSPNISIEQFTNGFQRLGLLRLVIGLKFLRQVFDQWESKPIAPCTRDFSRALRESQVVDRDSDWLLALFAPVVIGRSYITLVLVLQQSFENRSNTVSCLGKWPCTVIFAAVNKFQRSFVFLSIFSPLNRPPLLLRR